MIRHRKISRDSHWARRFPHYFALENPILRQHPENSRKRAAGKRVNAGLTWGCTVLDRENISGPSGPCRQPKLLPSFSAEERGWALLFSLSIPSLLSQFLPYSSQKQKMASPPYGCYDDTCPGRPEANETVLPEQVNAPTLTPPPPPSAFCLFPVVFHYESWFGVWSVFFPQ